MSETPDNELLRGFVQRGDEAAFRELVHRHVRLVYSAALRQTRGDRPMAEDVSQTVFTLLAKKSRGLLSHPSLAGWLFTTTRNCARDAARADARRQQRERNAVMNEAGLHGASERPEWDQLEPVLDEALHRLSAADRDGIVMRFFEHCSYRDIAAALGVGENAARMRVERALERLRMMLGRRGITSTAAALGAALTSHGAATVPAHLVAQISTSAATVVASAGAGGMLSPGILIMKSTKVITVIAVAAAGLAVYETQRARTAGTLAMERAAELSVLRADLAAMRLELDRAREQVQSADGDMARLVAAIEEARAKGEPVERVQRDPSRPSRAEVERRFEQARELARTGKSEEAMKEYLWCYDDGMLGGFSFMASRSKLIEAMGELAKRFAPMRDAMAARRARAEASMLRDAQDMDSATDLAALDRALGEPRNLLTTFAKLPAGDARRGTLLNMGAFDELLEQRRYGEVIGDRSFATMNHSFDFLTHSLRADASTEDRRRFRGDMVELGAKNVEVLAGAGQLDNARALAGKVLAYENSDQTKQVLRERLKRAGYPDLLDR
jgi:RNA polymerase sigma factor (sigma-70 family)